MSRRVRRPQFPFGPLTDDAGASADPVLVEIVQGSLASVEMEVETAIARTSRSPMIRDAHDFRAGIHDRLLRKLTGRSYSALVHPVARDFPIAEMREGDVFFHNDVYRSEGGIGHLPDLCVTVPVFARRGDGWSRSSRRSATTTTSAARCPGSMPSARDQRLRGGPDGPADPALGRRRAQPGGAGDHDPQLPDARVAGRRPRRRVLGLPDGRAAARRAVRPVRRGRRSRPASTRSSTAPPRRTAARSSAKIPVGAWVWEDYAEHDGVDEPRLHTQRITLTRTAGRRPRRRAAGPRLRRHRRRRPRGRSTTAATTADGVFLKKWLAPILRNLAETPGADGRARRQRGRRAADRDALPASPARC